LDYQIKLRGFRIELGEIEAALRDQPEVHDAVAVVREDRPGEKIVVAYVVPAEKVQMDEAFTMRLRSSLRHRLPVYMMPAVLVELPALPLNRSGKVERQALPAPLTSINRRPVQTLPHTHAERTIMELWSDVLQHDVASIHDNFFDIGGHSLLMLQLQGKLKSAFGKHISLMELFRYPTVSTLAEYFAEEKTQESDVSAIRNRLSRGREALERQSLKHQTAASLDGSN
jgi:acyl carrier protein